MILMIDWGNSYLKYIEIENLTQLSINQAMIKKVVTMSELIDCLQHQQIQNQQIEYQQILIASVRSNAENEQLKKYLSTKTQNLYFARTSPLDCGISCAYPEPSQLGIDRWLGILAVANNFDKVGIVSIGTAITLDIVVDKIHLGGQIIPGRELMFASLMTTGQVRASPYENQQHNKRLGQSTSDCVNFGIESAINSYLENIINEMEDQYQITDWVIAGGGKAAVDSLKFNPNRKLQNYPSLVFVGLLNLYQQ